MPVRRKPRHKEAPEDRDRDVVREAIRRRRQRPDESLRILSAHNDAVRRLNRAKR